MAVSLDTNYLINQDQDPSGQANPGGSAGGGGVAPPAGSTNALTKRWIDVKWNYTEPEPHGFCTGFELAIYAGTNIDNGQLAEPITIINNPSARRHISLLELRTQIALKAAVRAVYGDFRSVWANASTSANFIPDIQNYGDDGWLELPNGTIMQWVKTSNLQFLSHASPYQVTWPRIFPNTCYCVSVTTETGAVSGSLQSGFFLLNKNVIGCQIWRRAQGPEDHELYGHIIAFGY